MNVMNCRRCGKMFQPSGKPICHACVAKEEEDFETARMYVKEHNGCNMKEVAEETGISLKLLTKFIREKRIELSDGSTFELTCATCSTIITSGRYCNNCLSKLGKEMMAGVPNKESAEKASDGDKKGGPGVHIIRKR